MWCIEKIICIFNNILQKISSQKSFIWESENDHKKTIVVESFVIVGSFDCDCTHVDNIMLLHHFVVFSFGYVPITMSSYSLCYVASYSMCLVVMF
jgi:hypothetical protein